MRDRLDVRLRIAAVGIARDRPQSLTGEHDVLAWRMRARGDAGERKRAEYKQADDHGERRGAAAEIRRCEHAFDSRANACSCQGRNATGVDLVITFDMSTEISTTILPLLPLDDGVILPNMAIAIAITSDEARAAVDDALATDGPPRVVIATRRNGQFSPIGVVAELDGQPAMLPGGVRGATIRALHRAELGQGQGEGVGGAFRIAVTEHPDPDEVSAHAHELAREYRLVIEEILEARGASGIVAFLRTIEHPGALADTAGYSPELSLERKIELLETLDVELRLESALAWARDTLGEIELRRKIRDDVA
ncbi:MAG: ATP-dependent Lon protease, partial [Gaiellales bacterium]|nr:ATP-dependent Lon protease [Gaiellales bacterium]